MEMYKLQRNKQKSEEGWKKNAKITFEIYSELPICELPLFLTNSLDPRKRPIHISPSPLTKISKPHTVMLLPPHPTENLLKISFWQPARKHTLLSAASHQGFVRQARSEPGAFKTPIMQQDSAGQKEQECFRQSCGHTGIIHSSVAL